MATISWTSYTFNKPALISKDNYINIKNSVKSYSPNYNPFPKAEGFLKKYNILLKIYFIGTPVSILCMNWGNIWEGFEWIGGIFLFLLGGGLFSFIPEWISYSRYVYTSNNYYRNLMKNLRKSNNYNEFKILMD